MSRSVDVGWVCEYDRVGGRMIERWDCATCISTVWGGGGWTLRCIVNVFSMHLFHMAHCCFVGLGIVGHFTRDDFLVTLLWIVSVLMVSPCWSHMSASVWTFIHWRHWFSIRSLGVLYFLMNSSMMFLSLIRCVLWRGNDGMWIVILCRMQNLHRDVNHVGVR
jgi:hypothetical protein